MSTKTQNNALESAELGAKVDAIVQIVQEMAQEKPTSVNAYGLSTWTKAKKLITDLVKSYSAPVAAQAQPSGDRAMLLELMAAFDMEVWNCPNCTATEETKDCDSAIMLREYLANNPVPAQAQQPVSGADQFRDAAQMIEPSGNSGELFVSVRDALDWYAQQVGNCRRFGPVGDAARADLDADGGRRARAALAQQDADKVDAERYRAWRDAAVANSTPFVRAMRDTLPPEAREGKPRWPTAAEWDAAIDAARKEQA